MHTISADVPVPQQQPTAFRMSRGNEEGVRVSVEDFATIGLVVLFLLLSRSSCCYLVMNEALFLFRIKA